MNQTVFTAVLAVILGITSGFPLKTCDKLKGVQKGAENYDLYLVKMKNSKDAEYIVNLVSEYQATLDQHASNVHDPSVRSKLALTEDPGMLHGILSQQALFLVCSESRVEFILPDYPKSIIDPPDLDKPKDVYIAGCSKLAIKKPYHGANYSIIFKHKTSLNTLYHVITKIELAKLSDKTITFNYYYSVMKGKKVTMVAEMNDKAIYMVCEEKEVKQIKPKYDKSVTSKRDTEALSHQNLITTTLNGYCNLQEHDEEFPTFIFVYKKAASLDKIINSAKSYNKNSAKVMLATAVRQAHMIIFKMNRAAYLQACKNQEITIVEYAQSVTLSSPETATPKMPKSSESLPTEVTNTNICQHIDSEKDSINIYTVSLNRPKAIKGRRRQCLKLIKNLNKRSNSSFYAVTYPLQSCQIDGKDIKLIAKLSLKALKYVCSFERLQISATQLS